MSTKIKGAEYPLSKIFSSDFDYEIPSFQRPYAWTEEETGDLFDDLYDFYINEAEDEQYFLGSIVLVKEDDKLVFRCANSRIPGSDPVQHGIGLENTRKRLDLLYGSNYTLNIDESEKVYDIFLILPL